MDVTISNPTITPGAPEAIEFKRDTQQKTISDITIGEVKRLPIGRHTKKRKRRKATFRDVVSPIIGEVRI